MTRRTWLQAAAASSLAGAPAAPIDRFFEDFLLEWLRADPEAATRARLLPREEQERLDARLTDISEAGQRSRLARARDGLARLGKFDRGALSTDQRISAEMLEWLLRDMLAEEPFLSFRFPLDQMRGVQSGIPTLLTDLHPVKTVRDAENYLSRLEAAGAKLDQASADARNRAAEGFRPPRFILDESAAQMRRFTAPEPARNILVTSFAERLQKVETVDAKQRGAMTAAAERLVRDSLYPAYRRASDAVATIAAKATDEAGISRFPHGAEAYAFYLRRYTTTAMTAEEVHRKGLDEVARIEGEMDGLLRRLGYTEGSVRARGVKLAADNQYPDTPDVRVRVLADYSKMVAEAAARSAEAFDRRPAAPCIVQRIPEFQEANAAANYQSPPDDGSRPGIFRVPLRGPRFSRAGMRTLAHHEAIPGHHFQLALQTEMKSLPAFRRLNPFGPMSAFSEGWALYAERLASELGWFRDDPVSDIGRLEGELFRARRLVVDTGLHTKKWTRQQAIEYGINRSEVDRYITWPGQACSYKIGQLKILELRDMAKQRLGARFSLKEFHNVVLGNGSIPLAMLERVVGEWVKGKSA
jgi:uncharacterized protein (DUF885 family)